MSDYYPIDLGLPPSYASSMGVALNQSGQVLCSLALPSGSGLPKPSHAALWDQGRLRALGQFSAKCLNNRGQIAGSRTAKSRSNLFRMGLPASRACIFSHGRFIDLPVPQQTLLSEVTALNERGIAVGNVYVGTPSTSVSGFACVWNEQPKRLETPPHFVLSHPLGINDRGQIVGEAIYDKSSPEQARGVTQVGMIWEQGEGVVLPLLPGCHAGSAVAINENEVAVGVSRRLRQQIIIAQQACLWQKGQARHLGALRSGGDAQALGINDNMQIVGTAEVQKNGPLFHAFLWESDKMHDLNGFIPNGSGWTLISAMAINNRGEILCNGVQKDDPRSGLRAVLLQPI